MKTIKNLLLLFVLLVIKTEARETSCVMKSFIKLPEIKSVGENLQGDNQNQNGDFPCWLNLTLARQGQELAQNNFAQIFQAHLLSLILFLAQPHAHRTLASTGKSNTPKTAFRRYTATAMQIRLWYTEDILSPAWMKSIRTVRGIHRGFATFLDRIKDNPNNIQADLPPRGLPSRFLPNEKLWEAFRLDLKPMEKYLRNLERNSGDNFTLPPINRPGVGFNQYLMTLTQWSFVALPILAAQPLGIYWAEEPKGFVHLWAVLTHLLGSDERFILCREVMDNESWNKCRSSLKQVYFRFMVPPLLSLDTEGKLMIEAFLQAINKIIPLYPVDAMLIHLLETIVGVPAKHLRQLQSLQSRMMENIFKIFGLSPPASTAPSGIQFLGNNFIIGQLRQASTEVFGDPGYNASVVAQNLFY